MKISQEVVDRNILEMGVSSLLAMTLFCEALAVSIVLIGIWTIPFLLEGRASKEDRPFAKRVGIIVKMIILLTPLY